MKGRRALLQVSVVSENQKGIHSDTTLITMCAIAGTLATVPEGDFKWPANAYSSESPSTAVQTTEVLQAYCISEQLLPMYASLANAPGIANTIDNCAAEK